MGESGYLETGGGRLYYEVDGDGRPMVLIHAGVANVRMWDDQVRPFVEAGHRVIRYDTRGFGRTETDAVAFSNRADVAALLDHLGVRSVVLVGASRGGMIALDFALERPDRVEALVLAAGGISGLTTDRTEVEAAFEAEAERAWEARDWDRLADLETRYWVDGPGPADRVEPSVRRRVHEWILSTYRAEKEEGEPQPLDPPALDRLGTLAVPTLVLVGNLDAPHTQAAAHRMAQDIPRARLEIVEGVAHMINLERPADFNRLVLDFAAAA
jgi:3-oxoadipate enol-lactonase